MKRKMLKITIVMMMAAVICAGAQAAFIVEAHESGLANGNFVGSGSASLRSTAPGTTATNSIFGGSDDYLYSYTPGVDVDNYSSALEGGGDGLYNVYITWPSSTNVDPDGCTITVTSEGSDIVLSPVDMNDGGTGDPGGNDAWYLIGEGVSLVSGNTYSVNQVAVDPSWVSQRGHGVMWEAVPEPATMLLLGAGALFLRRKR